MAPAKPFFIVIMAGGSGSRLWPLSRKSHPKQFHAFLSDRTLLQETYDRVAPLVPKEHIFISTGLRYRDLVLKQLPDITSDRIIAEPEARNTGPAISLVAASIRSCHPEAIIATIASDHAIKNPDEFRLTLQAAFETVLAHPDRLVTVGINPTSPDTGLGYIKLGKEFTNTLGKPVFFVENFKEKPDAKTAEEYLRSYDYLWNAGYFIFQAAALHGWLEQLTPEMIPPLESIIQTEKAGSLTDETLLSLYSQTPAIAIEPLIVEKLEQDKRLVIPSPLEWSDIGNWNTLHEFQNKEIIAPDSQKKGHHHSFGSNNILVHGGKRLVATLNVHDLVIIDTDDALLVADKNSVGSDLKGLIEELKRDKEKERYL